MIFPPPLRYKCFLLLIQLSVDLMEISLSERTLWRLHRSFSSAVFLPCSSAGGNGAHSAAQEIGGGGGETNDLSIGTSLMENYSG